MYAPRHARPLSRRSRAVASLGAAVLLSGGLLSVDAAPASAADCTTPVLSDVMISQGLPSYTRLVQGKTALARFYLRTPSCLPSGTTVQVTGGSLALSNNPTPIQLSAATPLPPLAPFTTAPIANTASDPYFVIPGSSLLGNPVDRSTTTFTATINYTVTTPTSTVPNLSVTFDKLPGTNTPISKSVDRLSNPLRVLVVPMGDLGTTTAPKTALSQFPADATTALQEGMTSLARVLPVRDGVSDLVTKNGGLLYSVSQGFVDLHAQFGTDGKYCGNAGDFDPYIVNKLDEARNAWNSANPGSVADRVLGVIWQGVSRGQTTDPNSASCVEGLAKLGGEFAWSRVIASKTVSGKTIPGLTGSLAEMELLHTVGTVTGARSDGTNHSTVANADTTAPDRAFNISTQRWLSDDRTALKFQTDGLWNDGSTLLEKEDWDYAQCAFTPATLTASGNACPVPGKIGGNVNAQGDTGGSIFFAGSTDGTPAGTEGDSRFDPARRYETPDDASRFYLRQTDLTSTADYKTVGIHVSAIVDSHTAGSSSQTVSSSGTFSTEVEGAPQTTRIEFWNGMPKAAGSVLLYARNKDSAPQFLSVQASDYAVTVTGTDYSPGDLRLFAYRNCPSSGRHPLLTNVHSTVVGANAVFVSRIDSSRLCPGGTNEFMLSDGYLTTTQSAANSPVGTLGASAAIYAPLPGTSLTSRQVIAVSGAATDTLGRDVSDLRWTLTGPSYPAGLQIVTGAAGQWAPPATGLLAGAYTLRVDAYKSGTLLTSQTRSFTSLLDSDGDDLPDTDENQPCYPVGSVNDPRTANLDSDYDGVANIVDAAPCTTTSNLGIDFNPNSVNTGSSGNVVTVKVSGSPVDLTTLSLSDWQVQQVAGYRLGALSDGSTYTVAPVSVSSLTPTSATVKFDRSALQSFMLSRGLTGEVPVFIGASRVGIRGVDGLSPYSF